MASVTKPWYDVSSDSTDSGECPIPKGLAKRPRVRLDESDESTNSDGDDDGDESIRLKVRELAQHSNTSHVAQSTQSMQPALHTPFRDLSMAKLEALLYIRFINHVKKLIEFFKDMKLLKEVNAKRNRANTPKNLVSKLNPGAKSIESKNEQLEETTELLREVNHPWEKPFQEMLDMRYKPIIQSDKQDNGHKDVIKAINMNAFPDPPELTTCNQAAMLLNYVASDFELPRFKCDSEIKRRVDLGNTTDDQKTELYNIKAELQSAFNMSMSNISYEMLRYNIPTRICPFRHFLRGMPDSEIDGMDAENTLTTHSMASIPEMVFNLPLIHIRLIQRRKIVQWMSWAANADKWKGKDAKATKHLFLEVNPDEEAADAFVAKVWEQDKQKIRGYLDFLTDQEITELAKTVVCY